MTFSWRSIITGSWVVVVAVLIFLLDGLVARRLHPAVQDLRDCRVAGVR